MAALIADLDGTTFAFATEAFLPGAYAELQTFHDAGNQLIFTTRRNQNWQITPNEQVEAYLKRLFPGCVVLFNITSPRILINDEGAMAINHPSNAPWNYDLNAMVQGLSHG